MNEVTRILDAIHEGQPQAAAELLTLVYEELRRMAATKMAQENARQTLQPTALVHEAWLRLGGEDQPTWENRAHFFRAAAEAMRRILVERARRRLRLRHGGGQERVDFDELEIASRLWIRRRRSSSNCATSRADLWKKRPAPWGFP